MIRLLARFFCRHAQMIRVRDERGYGAECSSCGYYEGYPRSVQPKPQQKPPVVLIAKRSDKPKVIPWRRAQ